ncbi:MAG TPA: DinB family protein [Ignavibacteriaceae bacterium]|nr:DinB family protein [Ignavibacteriaceae bacterium]
MNDSTLRKNLVEMLEGEPAHVGIKNALEGINPDILNARPSKGLHSIWELFEHMRISQEDILRYTLDPKWVSPSWPEGHWPPPSEKATPEMLKKSISKFNSDLKEVVSLAKNSKIDLTGEIPHGEGRTYLREILLIIDHNAYHLGQILSVRKALSNWKA